MGRHALTAIIYDKKGRVLSIGKNSYTKTHPKMYRLGKITGKPENIFLHAEIHAIIKCRNLRKAHKIFIARHDKKGNPRLAKPCEICQGAIKEAGIKVIEYTVDE